METADKPWLYPPANRNDPITAYVGSRSKIGTSLSRICLDHPGEPMKWKSAFCLVLVFVLVYLLCIEQWSPDGAPYARPEAVGRKALDPDRLFFKYYRKNYRTRVEVLQIDPKQNQNGPVNTEMNSKGKGMSLGEKDIEDDVAVRKIVLLTYFRGGSTFLGELFNQNKRAFYWFEPLAAPMLQYKKQLRVKDYAIDKNEQPVIRPTQLVDTLLDTVSDILDCDIDRLDTDVKRHYFALSWHKSAKFSRYQACVGQYRLRHSNNVTDAIIRRCQRYLTDACSRSDVRVIKSIRLFVEETIPLALADPDVRLVYYVRDPRGILLSRWSLSKRPLADVLLPKIDQMAAYLCAKMRSDIGAAVAFRKRHPDRMLMVRYENLAMAPVPTVLEIYRFLGLDAPREVLDWVRYATHAARSDGMVGTNRQNATAVATRWRHELAAIHLAIIDQHCDDVIDMIYSIPFGYAAGSS